MAGRQRTTGAKFSEPFVEGRVYVVRGIRMGNFGNGMVAPAMHAVGIYGKIAGDGLEYAIWTGRFRKLDELKAESRERYYQEHPELQPSNP